MTSLIIGEATCIISKRSEPDVNNMKEHFGQIQAKLSKIENKINNMKEHFGQIQAKLSKIENKIEKLFENYQKKVGT